MSINEVVKISVRNLVEFVLRSGDLTSGFSSSSRALEGSKIHRQIQKAQGSEYQAEVHLVHQIEQKGCLLEISGRADGIIVDRDRPEKVIVDEIKSTTKQLEFIEERDNPLFWAQAKCYAYIYAQQHDLKRIEIQLTYCQFTTGEIKYFRRESSYTELADFFGDLIKRYFDWAEQLRDWGKLRNDSASHLEFPFSSYRTGQRQLAVAVYKTISARRKLYAQAPTGTGKTIATIFPAVKAMGMGLADKIFFLTAKTVTRGLAEEAFDKLRLGGLRFKTVTLTAKEKICFKPEAACTAEECEYARGYYDRVNAALVDMWGTDAFTREMIEEYASRHNICPFELSLDLSLWVDGIICDYNYVFDPRVYLKRFFNENGGEYCFLIDEAHNLVDRARDMFSAELAKKPFLELKRILKNPLPKVAKAAGGVNSSLLGIGKLCGRFGQDVDKDYVVNKEPPQEIFPVLRKFLGLAEEWLMLNEQGNFKDALLEAYFAVYAFMRVAESYDERYVTYVEKMGNDVKVKLFCVDPSYLLGQAVERGRSTIFFSATLTPLDYFSQILGGESEDGKIAVESPFLRENLCLLVAENISTTYKARDQTYDAVVDCIGLAIGERVGNYLVFLPSYQYMGEVYSRFCSQYPRVKVISQTSGMKEEERIAFLNAFVPEGEDTLVGFAVMGGIFGEGIDLTGERLVGAVVVGVGLPQVCLERDIIRNFFNEHNGQGFEYAYMYPGMNKVLQAAGRVIRMESDKGVVLLIDERFRDARYKRLFPQEWCGAVSVRDGRGITKAIQLFWNNDEKGRGM
ncbi:MAG: rad3: repair helicase (rad3) [Firmicutes bacterium]|nr:rad3: repair helicase (rad3) [Bacillota bacterium]